jgi:transmembrane sensor
MEEKNRNNNEKHFEDLIKRCLSGDASQHEMDMVERWLDQRDEKDPFGGLSNIEKETIRHSMFERLVSRMSAPAVVEATKGRSRKRVLLYGAALVITGLCLFTFSFPSFVPADEIKDVPMRSISSTGDSRKIILSDSSIVWLKGTSSIIFPEKFSANERSVELIGEALFEVTKHPDHPFKIQCGGLTAKVLGTSFNIKSNETDVEVLVLTGKVALSSKGNSQNLIVLPNEKAVYNEAQDQLEKVAVKEKERVAKTQGTEYIMRFNASKMTDIIQKIEGKFNVHVSLSDERLRNCTITADFTDQSLVRTLSLIAQTLGIEYSIESNEVNLVGTGCDVNTID